MPFTPLTQEQFQKARAAGFSPQKIIEMEARRKQDESMSSGVTPMNQEGDGFLKTLAKGIAKPFVTAGVTGLSALESGYKAATGDVTGANKVLNEGYNVPGFGKVTPIGAQVGQEGGYGKDVRRMLGTGAEIAATLAPVGEVANLGATGVRGLLTRGAIRKGAMEGALVGGAGSFGQSVQKENASPSDVLSSTVAGTTIGGVTGGVVPLIKAGKNLFSREPEKLLNAAIKAPKSMRNFQQDLSIVANDLKDKASNIDGLESLASHADEGKRAIWDEVKAKVSAGGQQGLISRRLRGNPAISGYSIADDIQKNVRVPDILSRTSPQEAAVLQSRIKNIADSYSGMIPFDDAERMIEELNAKHASYYLKNNTNRALAEKVDPELAAELRVADGLRKGLDNALSGFGDLKRKYAAFSNVSKAVKDRLLTEKNKELTDLPSRITAGQSAISALSNLAQGNFGSAASSAVAPVASKVIQKMESADSKVAEAFKKIAGGYTKKASNNQPLLRRAGMVGALRLPSAMMSGVDNQPTESNQYNGR